MQDGALKKVKKRLKSKEDENRALKELILKLNKRLDILADNFGNKTGTQKIVTCYP